MKYRKLRIAWSVAWGIAALLFVMLWVRSYHHYDFASHNFFGRRGFIVESIRGVGFVKYVPGAIVVNGYGSSVPERSRIPAGTFAKGTWGGFNFSIHPSGLIFAVPFWFLALIAIVFAIGPWIRTVRRFSLRTLLIATTLVAVVLGLIVWAVQ
jgi:hypothetical protein